MSETAKITMPEGELREKLSPEAYEVTQNAATERAFTSTLLENKKTGAYACVVCGTDLFSSDAKFDSGTGWPSFTEPANLEHVELHTDRSLGMARTEVICKNCHAHLGHVFPDGPGATGDRYCINGCALEFKEKQE